MGEAEKRRKGEKDSPLHRDDDSPIRVLVVDDSSFMRVSFTHILTSDKTIEVIGTASDGVDAVEKTKTLLPDVVLLDIEMPRMDGLAALAHIMAECPTPVVMISGLAEKDARIAIKSLEHGAVDFMPKPSGVISYDVDKIKDEIIEKVRLAAGVDVQKMALELPRESYQRIWPRPATRKEIVVIGASTGGPRAVETVLSGIQRDITAGVLVVQHMRPEFIPSFAERLQWLCALDVSIAEDNGVIMPGRVYVAPGSSDTVIEQNEDGSKVTSVKGILSAYEAQSIDKAMESAAQIFGAASLGVLLTGIGSDGANGLRAIKEAGGGTIAEDESTCIVYGMPKSAIEMGVVDEVAPLPRIADVIMRMV